MVADAIAFLYPNAVSLQDFVVSDIGTGPLITYWNESLGPQPTEQELSAVTQKQVNTARLDKLRSSATEALAATKAESMLIRAALLVIVDEFNNHSVKMNSLLDAIDGATNLATLKTAVAAIANLPSRTGAQLRTAAENKLTAGDAG